MPDLNNQPFVSSSSKTNGFNEITSSEPLNATAPVLPPTPGEAAPPRPTTSREGGAVPQTVYDIPRRRRSLRLQLRFWRTLWFAGKLFARILFWYWLMPRFIGQEAVDRGAKKRWVRYAREFRAYAVAMGGVMIKLGQFVSTRVDALPAEITDELAGLQDEVPSVPNEQIMAAIEQELGAIPARFRWIAPEPVAAASLGQVYRAQLFNNDRVVIKVQRPGIREIVYTDLAALMIVARVARRFRFIRRRADTVALAEEFGRVLLEEISYRHEANNATRFARMFKDDLGVYIPAIYSDHSTDSVLVIEDVTTIKITDFAAMEAAGVDRRAVAKRLMDTYLRQVFEERFFHADPHPGNLFVYPLPYENGQHPGSRPFYLIFVDFGMTGSLTPQLAAGLLNTLTAIVSRDAGKLVRSYQELGFLLPDADQERIVEATEMAFDQVWGLSMTDIKNVSYSEARELGKEFNDLLYSMPFQVPQDFIYLGRAMGILSGMATTLDPHFNPWQELQPYAQKMLARTVQDSTAGGEFGNALGLPVLQSLFNGDGRGAMMEIGRMVVNRLVVMPQQLDSVLGKADRGELTVRVTPSPAYRKQLGRIEAQARRTTRAVIFAALLISSTLLYTSGEVSLALAGFAASGVAFLTVLLSGE